MQQKIKFIENSKLDSNQKNALIFSRKNQIENLFQKWKIQLNPIKTSNKKMMGKTKKRPDKETQHFSDRKSVV